MTLRNDSGHWFCPECGAGGVLNRVHGGDTMSDRPLSPLMRQVLDAMPVGKSMTPNQIGLAIGLRQGDVQGGGRQGRGRDHRAFGPAQRIIPVLTALHRRGLIESSYRADGRSGTAYAKVPALPGTEAPS